MSEFDEWWKRTRKLFEEIDKLFEEIMRESMYKPEEFRRIQMGKPYIYGFSLTIGPDGIPRIREWGNIKPGVIRPRISETVEPFTDIIEEKESIKIVIDLPGVEKEDIKIDATENTIEVSAERGDRKYHKLIKLAKEIKPESTKAQYRNGVLTIIAEKKEKEKRKGFSIKIE